MSFYQNDRTAQDKFYKSRKWKACRKTYLSEHPMCERCAASGIATPAEHVHHKKELTEENFLEPLISLNPENLEALCFDCHRKEHHDGVKYGKREVGKDYYFDKNGNILRKNN